MQNIQNDINKLKWFSINQINEKRINIAEIIFNISYKKNMNNISKNYSISLSI